MIKSAAEVLQENYKKIGPLTDEQFVAVKARACAKRLIHAERITDVRRIDMGTEVPITLSEVDEDDTIRIKATIRGMLGGKEKTGFITLNNIREIYRDEAINMLVIDAENMMVTTLDCKNEVLQINAVIAGDNWVNEITLSELITSDMALRDLQAIRDKEPELDINDLDLDTGEKGRDSSDLSLDDLDTGFKVPDLLF